MTRPYRGGNVERELHGDSRLRLLREEQKLDELPKAGRFSLITASRAEGPFGSGWSFVSTPWSPYGETVTVIELRVFFGIPNPTAGSIVYMLKNGSDSGASVEILTTVASGSSSCSVKFSPSDVLTFYIPDAGGSWGLLTVYAVVSSPDQSAGLDFLFSEGGGG